MNEKRFVLEISSFSGKHMKFLNILDNGKRLNSEDIVDLLNEQQATITELESNKAIAEDYANIFEKENVKLRKKLNEQQDIIFKLQRYNDVLHDENLFNTMKMLEFMKEKGVFDEFYERIKKEVFGDE